MYCSDCKKIICVLKLISSVNHAYICLVYLLNHRLTCRGLSLNAILNNKYLKEVYFGLFIQHNNKNKNILNDDFSVLMERFPDLFIHAVNIIPLHFMFDYIDSCDIDNLKINLKYLCFKCVENNDDIDTDVIISRIVKYEKYVNLNTVYEHFITHTFSLTTPSLDLHIFFIKKLNIKVFDDLYIDNMITYDTFEPKFVIAMFNMLNYMGLGIKSKQLIRLEQQGIFNCDMGNTIYIIAMMIYKAHKCLSLIGDFIKNNADENSEINSNLYNTIAHKQNEDKIIGIELFDILYACSIKINFNNVIVACMSNMREPIVVHVLTYIQQKDSYDLPKQIYRAYKNRNIAYLAHHHHEPDYKCLLSLIDNVDDKDKSYMHKLIHAYIPDADDINTTKKPSRGVTIELPVSKTFSLNSFRSLKYPLAKSCCLDANNTSEYINVIDKVCNIYINMVKRFPCSIGSLGYVPNTLQELFSCDPRFIRVYNSISISFLSGMYPNSNVASDKSIYFNYINFVEYSLEIYSEPININHINLK